LSKYPVPGFVPTTVPPLTAGGPETGAGGPYGGRPPDKGQGPVSQLAATTEGSFSLTECFEQHIRIARNAGSIDVKSLSCRLFIEDANEIFKV
jgi:hypothetical protein